jgi:hypothetical protein
VLSDFSAFSSSFNEAAPIISLSCDQRLVALAACFNHLPRVVSDSPPLWPGTQHQYPSAVSKGFSPASTQGPGGDSGVMCYVSCDVSQL